ncbi:MAG: fibrobacter succinogenes major paralogous domain-containing protein, partial [Tannerella sp.]|nr:fibrobacter succinogenes major paralogous domain-containing protein [Tannerella sp.]
NNRYRHRIWIRQGEGDDFLMRNSDPLTGGNRTLAARFSPFNLTANALPEYAGTPTSVQVGLNGGNFVKFPTQGGTFWYWATDAANATTYLRRAYHPGNPLNYSGSTPPWLADNLDTGNDTWDEANNSETCPSGYRRPNDGATNAAVPSPAINSSEIRQSLWLNPPTGDNDNTDNSVWGYYADGYFDRYGIETTLSGGGAVAHDFAPQTAVTPLTKNAAYMGRLVYNPNNLASLFFPAAGHRGSGEVNPAGELLGAGNGGFYWTSTASNVTTGTYWALYFVAGGYDVPPELSQKTLAANNKAMSIRCVKTEVPPVPPMPDIQDAPYVWVGAFWKYNQRGERLIRWSNTGPWTATVTAGGTDIIMDQSLPANTAVEWLPNPTGTLISGNDPSFETNYQVPGNQQTVSGNGAIYFRIGWKTALTNPTAHRYGKITVTYANGTRTQDIYLRQGEYPDYIISGRNNSKAFAAYNLTYDNDIWNVGTGTALTDHPQLGVGGGTFVDYPTQAGAYFQWALPSGNAALRRAFHPVTPNTDEITGWEAFNSPPLWNDVSSINETCPSLYRRPNDGSTSAQETNSNPNTNVSEMRQSLYASMPTGTGESSSNSVYGYYADGFYDRRKLLSYQAVSNTNSQVAYVGMLFFNANDNKSIFFPSAGERDWQRGQRNQPGGAALYWSSSSVDASTRPNAWILYAANGQRLQWTHDKNSALSIRCVLITNP